VREKKEREQRTQTALMTIGSSEIRVHQPHYMFGLRAPNAKPFDKKRKIAFRQVFRFRWLARDSVPASDVPTTTVHGRDFRLSFAPGIY